MNRAERLRQKRMKKKAQKQLVKQANATHTPAHGNSSLVSFSEHRAELHVGPIPSPEQLAEYARISPGLAERIVTMAEVQAGHRQGLETKSVDEGFRGEARRTYAATFVAFSVLMVAALAIWRGHPVSGATLGSLDIAGIIGAYLTPHFTKKKDPPQD